MKNVSLHITLFVLICILSPDIQSQTLIPLNRIVEQNLEAAYYKTDQPILPVFHGYYKEDLNTSFSVDSVLYPAYKNPHSWFGRKLWNESFIRVDSSDYQLDIDPLFNLQAGRDQQGNRLLTNTRGAQVLGKLGKNFSFGSWFYENQSLFLAHWDTLINTTRVAPGQGRAKRYQENGWDYAYAGAYVSWRAGKSWNLEFGRGKNFIGNGYRSMILSDVSSNYPYLRIDYSFKQLHYVKLFGSFTNMFYPSNDVREFYRKTGTLQLLSYNLGKKIQISVFDLNLWNSPDSTGKFNLKPGMINPIPGLSSFLGSGRENLNSLDGINISWHLAKGMLLYGQWVFKAGTGASKKDGSSGYAFQLGWKYYDILGIPNLFTLLELNQAQPYTFSHIAPILAATNYQQPLGHPLGANFREGVWLLNYQYRRIMLDSRITRAKYGADQGSENWGRNLLLSSSADKRSSGNDEPALFQGTTTHLTTLNLEASYIINFHTRMSMVLGCYVRNETSASLNDKSSLIYFAFRTNLLNLYYDY